VLDLSTHDYPRRQDLEPVYFINGACYVNRTRSLRRERTFYPEGLAGYVMPQARAHQIDTPDDFHLCDLLLRDRQAEGS
jgi:CMP-N-acetylneuraminic acid synthetase